MILDLWYLFQYDDVGICPGKKATELGVMPRHIWPPEVAAKSQKKNIQLWNLNKYINARSKGVLDTFYNVSMYLWPKTNAHIRTLHVSYNLVGLYAKVFVLYLIV